MMHTEFSDGYVLCADSVHVDTARHVREMIDGAVPLIIADPPYGNVVTDLWDRVNVDAEHFAAWMVAWTRLWALLLAPGGAFYVWGGAGRPGFRPFFKYLTKVEIPEHFELATPIVWGKKRAYGVQHNYLWTREELAYFVNGPANKPRCFHVPLLDEKRGYAGYNKKYPAKSEYKRRTNVWTDVTEILRGKQHTAEKPQRVLQIPIEVHTELGEWVVDPFAGSGATALAARGLGRRFVVVEKDPDTYERIVQRLAAVGSGASGCTAGDLDTDGRVIDNHSGGVTVT